MYVSVGSINQNTFCFCYIYTLGMGDPGSGGPWEWGTLGVVDPGNGGPWEWRTLGMADRHRFAQPVSVSRISNFFN
jgi:hypothetical protein